MIEDGVYIIKQDFFVMFEKQGCKFKNNKLEKRPTFCCMKDNKIEGLYKYCEEMLFIYLMKD